MDTGGGCGQQSCQLKELIITLVSEHPSFHSSDVVGLCEEVSAPKMSAQESLKPVTKTVVLERIYHTWARFYVFHKHEETGIMYPKTIN